MQLSQNEYSIDLDFNCIIMNFAYFPFHYVVYSQKKCSVQDYNTRNSIKLRPALARHAYRDKDFRFVSVYVWNYLCDNVSMHVSFP